MSEDPNQHIIDIRTMAGSREEIKRMVDLLEAEMARRFRPDTVSAAQHISFAEEVVHKAAAFQADRISRNPFRRLRALLYWYRNMRMLRHIDFAKRYARARQKNRRQGE